MNITTLAQLNAATIDDFDATDIAYLTLNLPDALFETTRNGQTLLSQLPPSLVQYIEPSLFAVDGANPNDRPLIRAMTQAQRQGLSWDQLNSSVSVVTKLGAFSFQVSQSPVLSQITNFDDLSAENRAKLTSSTFAVLSNGFLNTAPQSWLTDKTANQFNLKYLTPAQWLQLRNLDFSKISASDLDAYLPDAPLSKWTLAMLRQDTATVAEDGSGRKVKVFEVLDAKQMSGVLNRLNDLTVAEIRLLKATQLTSLSTSAWFSGGFWSKLTATDFTRLAVPADALVYALRQRGTPDADGKPRTLLTVEQIRSLTATQLSSLITSSGGTVALIGRIISAGQADALNPAVFTADVVALLSPDVFKNNVFSRAQLLTITADGSKTFLNLLTLSQVAALNLSQLNQADIQTLSIDQQTALSNAQFAQKSLDGKLVSSFLSQSGSIKALWEGIKGEITAVAVEKNANTKAILKKALVAKIQSLSTNQLTYTLPENGLSAMTILGKEYIAELKVVGQLNQSAVLQSLFKSGLLQYLTEDQLFTLTNGLGTQLVLVIENQAIDNVTLLHGINWNARSVRGTQALHKFLFGVTEGLGVYYQNVIPRISRLTNLNQNHGKNSALLQNLTLTAANGTQTNTTVFNYLLNTINNSTLTSTQKQQCFDAIDLNFFRYAATAKSVNPLNGRVGSGYLLDRATLNRALTLLKINGGTMYDGGSSPNSTTAGRDAIYKALLESGRFKEIDYSILYGSVSQQINDAMDSLSKCSDFSRVFSEAGDDFFDYFTAGNNLQVVFSNMVRYPVNASPVTTIGKLAIGWINWRNLSASTVARMGDALVEYLNADNLSDDIVSKLSVNQIDNLGSGTLSLSQFNKLSTDVLFSDPSINSFAGRIWWQTLKDGTPIISLMTQSMFDDLVANNVDFVVNMLDVARGPFDMRKVQAFLNTTLAGSDKKVYERLSDTIFDRVAEIRGAVLNASTYEQSTKDGTQFSTYLKYETASYFDLSSFDDSFVYSFLNRSFTSGNETKTGRELIHGYNLSQTTLSGTKVIDFFSDAQITAFNNELLSQSDLHFFWETQRDIVTTNENGTTTTVRKYLYELLNPNAIGMLPGSSFAGFSPEDMRTTLSNGETLLSKAQLYNIPIYTWDAAMVGNLSVDQVDSLSDAQLTEKINDGTKLLKSISAQAVANMSWIARVDFTYWLANEFTAAQLSSLSYDQLTSNAEVKTKYIGSYRNETVKVMQIMDEAKLSGLSGSVLGRFTADDLKLGNYLGGKTINRLNVNAIPKLNASALADAAVISELKDRHVSSLLSSQLETNTTPNAQTQKFLAQLLTESQAAGLTIDQLYKQFTNTVLGYTTDKPLLIQVLDTKQLGGLSGAVLEDITSEKLLLKDKGNITVLSKLSVRGIGKLNGAALQVAGVITTLSDVQAGGLTVAQLSRASTIAVDDFLATDRPMLIQRLSATQLGNLSNEVLDTITSEMLLATDKLSATILSKLTDAQLGKLGNALSSSDVLTALTSRSKIGVLTLGQLSRLSGQTMLIHQLTSNQLSDLSDTVLANLTPAVLFALDSASATVLSKLSATQVGKLSDAVLLNATVHNALTATQVGGLSLSQLSLAATQSVANYLPAARPLLIQRLTGTQLGGLSDTRMGELTSNLLALQDNTGATVLSKLSGAKVDKLSAAVLGTGSVFQALTVSQLAGLQSTTWSTTLAGLLTSAKVDGLMALDNDFIFKTIGSGANATPLYKSLSASGISGIKTMLLTEAEVIQVLVTDLTDAQAAGLTADQLGYATTTPLANFGNTAPILIRMLSGTQLGNLSAGVADLTASLLLATTSGNEKIVTKLSANAAALLSNSVLQDADVLAALGTTQVGGLTLSQLSVASTGSVPGFQANDRPLVIQRLTDTQLLNLSDAVLGTLTYAILSATNSSGATILSKLSATEVGKLSDSVLLNADVLTALSDAQVAGLSLAQLGLAATQAVTGFLSSERPLLIQRLTSTQLGLLTDTRLSDLTANMLLAKDKDGNTTVSKLAGEKIGKLNTSVWQTSNVFQALSASQLGDVVDSDWSTALAGLLSGVQVGDFMDADNDFIFKTLGSGNNTSPLYKSLSASGIGGIDTSLLTEAEVIQVLVTDLTDAQVAGLTAAQLGYATTTVLNEYGDTAPLLIQLLSDTQLSELSAGVSGLTTNMLNARTRANDSIITKLSDNAVGKLSGAALHDADVMTSLTRSQVGRLTFEQLSVASTGTVNGFLATERPLLIQRLNLNQLGYLSDDVLGSLTSSLLLSKNLQGRTLLSAMSSGQVSKFNSTVFEDENIFSTFVTQIGGLTLDHLKHVTSQSVQGFVDRPMLIQRLTSTQLQYLSSTVMAALTKDELLAKNKRGETVLSQFSSGNVANLGDAALNTPEVFQALSGLQVTGLVSRMSVIRLRQLSGQQVEDALASNSSFLINQLSNAGGAQFFQLLSADGISGITFNSSTVNDARLIDIFGTRYWTEEQMKGVTKTQLEYELTGSVAGISGKAKVIQVMDYANLNALSDAAFNDLTSSLLLAKDGDSATILSKLNPPSVGKLSGAVLANSSVLGPLTARQASGLTIGQLRYQVSSAVPGFPTRPTIIQLLSQTQLAALSDLTLGALTPALLLSLDKNAVTILSKLSPVAVGKLSGSALEDATLRGALSTEQLAGLTFDQLSAVVQSNRSMIIQLLSAAQLGALSNATLGRLTPAMLLAQDSAQATVLSKLTSSAIDNLSREAIEDSSVLSALTRAQIGGFTLGQLSRVASWSVRGFTGLPMLIQRLSDNQLGALSDAVLGAMTPAMLLSKNSADATILSKLSATAIGKLSAVALHNSAVLKDLTALQIGGLTSGQLSSLATVAVTGFAELPTLLQRLSDTQLGGLSDTVLGEITPALLFAKNSAGARILSKLSATAVGKLGSTTLADISVFQALTAAQLSGLASSTWSDTLVQMLTGTQVTNSMTLDSTFIEKTIGTEKLYKLLSPEGIGGISLNALTGTQIQQIFCTDLTVTQAAGLTKDQLSYAVDTGNNTSSMLIHLLSSSLLGGLSDKALGDLTSTILLTKNSSNNTVLSKFADDAIGKLSGAVLDNDDVLAALSANQAKGLTHEQLSRASSAAVTGFLETERPMLIQRLSAAQLAKLSDGALESLTSSMLLGKNSSGVAVIDNLPAASVVKLGNMALQSGTVLAELDQTHVQQLTSEQLETLFSISSGKSTYVLQNLALSQYAYLTQTQLDKLWNAEYRTDMTSSTPTTTASRLDQNAADQLIQSIASRLNSNQLPTWYTTLHPNNNNNLAS